MKRLFQALLLLAGGVVVASCGVTGGTLGASKPEPPRLVQSQPRVDDALACIANTHALEGKIFAVALWADGTRKGNAVADGATGNFLPGPTTSTYIASAVIRAGGIALNRYENDMNQSLSAFGGKTAQAAIQQAVLKSFPDFQLNGSFTGLDFLGGPDVEGRIGGIGPILVQTGAKVNFAMELNEVGSGRLVTVPSYLERDLRSTQTGVSVSKIFGDTLVTGSASYIDQQALQASSLQEPAGIMVADLVTRVFPAAQPCRGKVDVLLNPGQTPPKSTAPVLRVAGL